MALGTEYREIHLALVSYALVCSMVDIQPLARVAELAASFGALDRFVAPLSPFWTRQIGRILLVARWRRGHLLRLA